MNETRLFEYNKGAFLHGRSNLIRLLWLISSWLLFNSPMPYPNRVKCQLLRLFGARIGRGVVIRPAVKIKQPWRLEIGDFCWIGEDVWIDNLVQVSIGSNVCLSQGAFLLTGNHNYKKFSFDLITGEINLEDGVWIGAKSVVGPGVTCRSHSVLVAGSYAFHDLDKFSIYQGNPARLKRIRHID